MTRAGREKWLAEGLVVLTQSGPSAVTIELLAARLGVQRGSFAWHFGDLDAFRAALVEHWAARALGGDAAHVFSGDPGADRAMRAWALGDEAVKKAVARVDADRLARLTELHRAKGHHEPERLALLEHATFIGASWLFEDLTQQRALATTLEEAIEVIGQGSARKT